MPQYCVWENNACSTSTDITDTLAEAIKDACASLTTQFACVVREVVPTYCRWVNDACKYKSGWFENPENEMTTSYQSTCEAITSKDMCSYNNTEVCQTGEVRSETGQCVRQPWYDWKSCSVEMDQGACPDGDDPNPMVYQTCPYTCTRFTLKRLEAAKPKQENVGSGRGG
jgi:hypothetical protein